MGAKKTLAETLATRFQGSEAAKKARIDFEQKFYSRDMASMELPTVSMTSQSSWTPLEMVLATGVTTSRGEARRLIQQGGVELDNVKLLDAQISITPKKGTVLKIGKKNFFRIE